MATYAIGDIQGCLAPLKALLDRLNFDPARDRVWFTGDLVNRGPDSLEVLRFVHALGDSALTVLGNHDIHLLAIANGHAKLKSRDSLQTILDAEDGPELLRWLRHRPLMHWDTQYDMVLVHAGILPGWTLEEAQDYAGEVTDALRGDQHQAYFEHLYGNEPDLWDPALTGWDRLRFITNVFTRMRYCADDARLMMDYKGSPGTQPFGYTPWFEHPARREKDRVRVIFGHWSTLGFREDHQVLALDTGCLWGGSLTAVRIDDPALPRTSLPCEAIMQPRPGL